MAKEAGLAITTLSVDDSGGTARDIRNDMTNWDFRTPRGEQDITGIDRSARERLLLLADFSINLNGVFNDAAAPSAHTTFKTVPSTSVARTTSIEISGQLLYGDGTVGLEVFYTDYALTRPITGELTWNAPGVMSGTRSTTAQIPTWS